MNSKKEKLENIMSIVFYPVILLSTIFISTYAILNNMDLGKVYGYYLIGLVTILVFTEQFHPIKSEWKINRKLLFRRDLPYMLLGGATLGLANFIVGYFLITFSMNNSHSLWDMPIIFDFLLSLLLIDFLWYWYHRLCHENKSKVGNFLWNVHVAHHLPKQVYVLMHAVSHPLNTLIARGIMTIPLFILGFSAEVVFLVNIFMNLQTMISHYNVNIRAGFLNYFIIGSELHRYHHSTNPKESKNYGSVLTVWDHLFGTFYYKPKRLPKYLGVSNPENYPDETEIVKIITMPFSKVNG